MNVTKISGAVGGMRPSTLVLSCAVAGFAASAALAKAVNYTSVEATAGKPLQLTYHASAHKGDCKPAPLVTFDVLQPPKLGLLIVRKALLTTNKVPGCPGLRNSGPGGVLSGAGWLRRDRPCRLQGDELQR